MKKRPVEVFHIADGKALCIKDPSAVGKYLEVTEVDLVMENGNVLPTFPYVELGYVLLAKAPRRIADILTIQKIPKKGSFPGLEVPANCKSYDLKTEPYMHPSPKKKPRR